MRITLINTNNIVMTTNIRIVLLNIRIIQSQLS